MSFSWIDILGYVGTLFVLVSFMCKSVLRLRIINMIGAVLIVIYSLIIEAYPVVFLDFMIVIINGYQVILFLKR